MAQYRDVPIYFAHADGDATDNTVVDTLIDASVASGSIKSADDAIVANYKQADEGVKAWADAKFQTKN